MKLGFDDCTIIINGNNGLFSLNQVIPQYSTSSGSHFWYLKNLNKKIPSWSS